MNIGRPPVPACSRSHIVDARMPCFSVTRPRRPWSVHLRIEQRRAAKPCQDIQQRRLVAFLIARATLMLDAQVVPMLDQHRAVIRGRTVR